MTNNKDFNMSQNPTYDSQQKEGIHQLLDYALNETELDSFGQRAYPDVINTLSFESTKTDKIQALIEHCAAEGQLGKLVGYIKKLKPDEFKAFAQQAKQSAEQQKKDEATTPLARTRTSSDTLVVPVRRDLIHNPERLIDTLIEGRYRIDDILDKTGIGAVFKAYDTKLRLDVAIKVIDLDQVDLPAMKERVRSEVQTAIKLDHPGVVKVYDFGQSGSLLYLIMELISGYNLIEVRKQFEMLEQQSEPVWQQIVGIVRQICLTIDYMHQQGVLHPGTKPENIMLKPAQSSSTDVWQPVLINLGLLRPHRETLADQEIVSMRRLTYTISPELLLGHTTDIRSDVYAIGIILYDLLVGNPPFRPTSLEEAFQFHVETEPTPPRTLKPDLSEELEAVILRALAKDPSDRYLSMKEMAQDLAGILGIGALPSGGRKEIRLSMDAPHLTVVPGQTLTTELVLYNAGEVEDQCQIRVEGVSPEWVSLSPSMLKLNPSDHQVIELTITPPNSPFSRAGRHVLILQAVSADDAEELVEIQKVLTVAPFSRFESTLWPQEVTAGEVTQVTIQNQGNMTERFTIRHTSEKSIKTDPEQVHVKVPPGENRVVDFRITPRRQLWVADAKTQTFTFQVGTSQGRIDKVSGQIFSKGFLSPIWALSVTGILAMACCLILGTWPLIFPSDADLAATRVIQQATMDAATAQVGEAATATMVAATIQAVGTQEAQSRSTADMNAWLAADDDFDGLNNGRELELGTKPDNPDTDADNISDRDEVEQFGTNPLWSDTDYDGISDADEIQVGLDPTKLDSDGDGDPDQIDAEPRFTPTLTPENTATPTASPTLVPSTTPTPTPVPSPTPALVVNFSEPTYLIPENESPVRIALTLSELVDTPIVVTVITNNRSAIGGGDYATTQQAITLNQDNPITVFEIEIFDDVEDEIDEEFIVVISRVEGGRAQLGVMSQATIRIIDDDEAQ